MKDYFQIALIVIFILAAVVGVFVFSGAINIGNNQPGALGTVTLWGTVRSGALVSALEEFNKDNPSFIVKYVEKPPETFDQELLEALAGGKGPDMFFLPDSLLFRYSNKISPIPYESYPVSAFKNNFASAGEVFLTSKGILAFPMAIDPLVMYYNRSMLDSSGIVYPPASWTELIELVPSLTKLDDSNKIIKSTVAMGHFSNIAHAKEILSAIFMQIGNPIVAEKDGFLTSALSGYTKIDLGPTLKFYTDFADPLSDTYSWNRSLPNSRDAFSAENLAFYFGFASELQSLINKNPNQNFLVAPIPQIKTSNFKATSAHVTGIAISSFSKNFLTAFTAGSLMATGDFASKFADALGVVPIRRDLLRTNPGGVFAPAFYASALYADSWLDPSDKDTDNIFRSMVDGVLSNSMSPSDAVRDANSRLNLLFRR